MSHICKLNGIERACPAIKCQFCHGEGSDVPSRIDKIQIHWTCRFHPTEEWHEVGCPHRKWTVEELQKVLEDAKRTIEYNLHTGGHVPRWREGLQNHL